MGGPDQIAAVSVKIRSDGCTLLNAALFHVYSGTTGWKPVYIHTNTPTEKTFEIILSFFPFPPIDGFLV